ncbi:hypothetical protein BBJ29_004692 [Phytophthora kernoviae]|uniref:Uncharacterized protein n=1 Tax=Phytophthora kernoviae TaxID=325452 RepID=A0A3F2RV68_9STRA|nr:hypothetical protein BBJ29_004692 [Phytophthora kernoviae]RLN64810.1 hypothetical protein BBP00_00003223 [Phytophthora kernoviae]
MPTEEEHAFVLAFLRLATAPNVKDGDICGADALVGYWKIFSLTFDDVQFEIERMEKGGGSSLIATTTTTVTISNNTLQALFPHLTSDKTVGTKGKVLAAKLLGQRLVMRGSVHFDWDDMNSQVVNMHTQLDLLTPLLHLLGNLEDVSRVFKNAFLHADCVSYC